MRKRSSGSGGVGEVRSETSRYLLAAAPGVGAKGAEWMARSVHAKTSWRT